MGLLVHDLGHSSVCDDITGPLDELTVQITNEIGINI